MDRNILLTYKHKDGHDTFSWFESIEECNDFIECYIGGMVAEVSECVDCSNCRDMIDELKYKLSEE